MNDEKAPEATVEITESEYNKLVKNTMILNALEAGGVDNWEWYGDSMQIYWDSIENQDENDL